jgi:hypothetical protein
VSSDKHWLFLVWFLFCSIFSFLCNVLYFFFLFFWSLYNVLSVLLRFTISDYPYDIFKLLLDNILTVNNPNFLAFVHQIYSMELSLDKAGKVCSIKHSVCQWLATGRWFWMLDTSAPVWDISALAFFSLILRTKLPIMEIQYSYSPTVKRLICIHNGYFWFEQSVICLRKENIFCFFNNVFRTGGPFWLIAE